MSMLRPTGAAAGAVHYPSSDGKPVAETDWHLDAMIGLIELLKQHYRDDALAYVAGNNFVYFEEGNPRAAVSPDVYVVLGVPKGKRRVFKVWEEGAAPAVVFEVSSRKTRREDQRGKMQIYAGLGVQEYFLFDPEHDYLDPPLQGFRLVGDRYVPLLPGVDGTLTSSVLGLGLGVDGPAIGLFELETGDPLLSAEKRAELADASRAEAEARAEAASRENARLKAELARLRGEL